MKTFLIIFSTILLIGIIYNFYKLINGSVTWLTVSQIIFYIIFIYISLSNLKRINTK